MNLHQTIVKLLEEMEKKGDIVFSKDKQEVFEMIGHEMTWNSDFIKYEKVTGSGSYEDILKFQPPTCTNCDCDEEVIILNTFHGEAAGNICFDIYCKHCDHKGFLVIDGQNFEMQLKPALNTVFVVKK